MSQVQRRNNKKTKKNNKMSAVARVLEETIPTLSGQGSYYSEKILPKLRQIFPDGTFARAGANTGRFVGSVGASMINPALSRAGGSLGSGLGSKMGSAISRLVGFGDYEVKNNSILTVGGMIPAGQPIPTFGVMGQATRVRHREYLFDLAVPATPTAFNNTTLTVNPGDSYTFPWLASLAVQYQQYKFNGLIFEFKTLSSDITAGGALGSVIMASNYDVVQPSFADKIQMENSQYAVSGKPSCSQIHTMECLPSATANNLYYVRNTGPTSIPAQDNRFYDLANFQIATSGLPGTTNTVLGELWVSYDVSLYKPIINEALEGGTVVGVSPSSGALFGVNPTVVGDFVAGSDTLIFNQIGEYLVYVQASGVALSGGFTLGGTAQHTQLASTYSASTTLVGVLIKVKVTVPEQSLILGSGGVTSIASSEAFIGLFSYSL